MDKFEVFLRFLLTTSDGWIIFSDHAVFPDTEQQVNGLVEVTGADYINRLLGQGTKLMVDPEFAAVVQRSAQAVLPAQTDQEVRVQTQYTVDIWLTGKVALTASRVNDCKPRSLTAVPPEGAREHFRKYDSLWKDQVPTEVRKRLWQMCPQEKEDSSAS